jgi:hypothetical protein
MLEENQHGSTLDSGETTAEIYREFCGLKAAVFVQDNFVALYLVLLFRINRLLSYDVYTMKYGKIIFA